MRIEVCLVWAFLISFIGFMGHDRLKPYIFDHTRFTRTGCRLISSVIMSAVTTVMWLCVLAAYN